MADLAILAVLVFGLVAGLRRGFFKEAISIFGLVVASYVSLYAYAAAGPIFAEKFGMKADVGYLVAGIVVWCGAYFAAVLVGRLAWRSLRGKGPLSRIENAAGGAADVASGNTGPAPVTVMLRPLPTRAGVLYWLDKVLGGALGVAQAALVVLVVFFAAMSLPMGKTGHRIRDSNFYSVFKTDLAPELATIPEVKVVRSIGDMSRLLDAVEEKPERMQRVKDHPQFDKIESYVPFREFREDPDLQTALKGKHFGEALRNPKLIALMKDGTFRRLLSEIDWQLVLRDVTIEPPLPGVPGAPGSGTGTGTGTGTGAGKTGEF